jgi:tight adherence protein B
MSSLVIAVAVFLGVSALVGGLALLLRQRPSSKIEDRLDVLMGIHTPASAKEALLKQASVLAQPLDAMPGILENWAKRIGNVDLLFEQADTQLTLSRLAIISLTLALAGAGLGAVLRLPLFLLPLPGLVMAFLPVFWLFWRRRRRLRAFAVQLPDALDLLARALRAGQSLGAGFSMVASEVSAPLGKEFGRVFEEQNLGIPLEEALESLTERVPNLDLKFFATALVLQRQTGGDLAEILDKIGSLIRERFQIWGQVQALTGEGRLSGVVLMGLPFVLFLALYKLNPDYVMVLFTDPMGRRMLAFAIVMQVLGALCIRKIVDIKV